MLAHLSLLCPRYLCVLLVLGFTVLCQNVSAQNTPAFTTVYAFQGGTDGGNPFYSGLTVGADGAFYGTTSLQAEAPNCQPDCGTAYRLSPPAIAGGAWTETVLHAFTGQNGDGALVYSGLTLGPNGVLYGTTVAGGDVSGICASTLFVAGCGTVFELVPPTSPGGPWTENVLYRFTGYSSDGSGPFGSLAVGKNGELYGTTSYGGRNAFCVLGCGTVFLLKPPAVPGGSWSEAVIYNFGTYTGDALAPTGGVIVSADGSLYGTSSAGGSYGGPAGAGTVFELKRPTTVGGAWTESLLYNFMAGNDAFYPIAGLTMGKQGEFYGTTINGGAYGGGTVFALMPPASAGGNWTETLLQSFKIQFRHAQGGAAPYGGLVISKNGTLYGTAEYGGTAPVPWDGIVFALRPPSIAGGAWQETVLYNFTGTNGFGGNPEATLLMNNGVLYGTTNTGGVVTIGCFQDGCGTVFQLTP